MSVQTDGNIGEEGEKEKEVEREEKEKEVVRETGREREGNALLSLTLYDTVMLD